MSTANARYIVNYHPPTRTRASHYAVVDTVGRYTESVHVTRPPAASAAAALNGQSTAMIHLQVNSMQVRCSAVFDRGTASADMDRVTCPICRPSLALNALRAAGH